jgi:hypothetical protein
MARQTRPDSSILAESRAVQFAHGHAATLTTARRPRLFGFTTECKREVIIGAPVERPGSYLQ